MPTNKLITTSTNEFEYGRIIGQRTVFSIPYLQRQYVWKKLSPNISFYEFTYSKFRVSKNTGFFMDDSMYKIPIKLAEKYESWTPSSSNNRLDGLYEWVKTRWEF